MSNLDKYYEILGLKPEASEKEIIEAYKVLVKVWNPDRFSDDPHIQRIATEKIKEIDQAFKQLLIPEQTAITEKEQPPVQGEKPYGIPTPSLFEPQHEPSSKPFQKEGLKDEAPPDGQSVKPPHGGLGVGAKIGLTVMVVLISAMIYGLLREIVGHGQYIFTAIEVGILIYIWSRPGRTT
jgi:hypothetical protein